MDPVDEDALPPSARAQPAAPTAAPAARAAPSEDDLPPSVREAQAAEKEAGQTMNPLVEGWRSLKESAHGVYEGFRPPDTPTEGPWSSFKRTGSGLMSAAGLPFAFPMGVAKSVIAHGVAPVLRGTEKAIKEGVQQVKPDFDPAIPSHQEAYEALKPGAEAAISALGPKRLPGGGVAPIAPATVTKGAPSSGPIATERRLATQGGREIVAGQMLEKAATDPDAAIGALGAAKEIVPGSRPTTFQASGDLGLGQMERVVQNTPEGQSAFQQRWAEQSVARNNALRGVNESRGDPEAVSAHLRTAMEADDALAITAEQAARARAEQAAEALGGDSTPEIYGQVLRRELDMANAAARAEERRLWEAVDPNNELLVASDPVMNAEFQIYRGNMTQAGAASLTEGERRVSNVIQNYQRTVPFQEMRDLRSLVSTELRKELYTNGQSPAYARLSRLRGAIEESVSRPVSTETGQLAPEAGERLREASAATRQRAETFKQEPVKGALKRQGTEGPYGVTNAAVPGRFVPNGPKGYDTVTSYLRAVGNERGLPDIADVLVSDMRSKVLNPDGSINPDKLVRWAMGKQDALRAVTERDGGDLVRRLQNAEEASQAIVDVAAQRNQLADLHREGVFGKLIGANNPTDVQNILGSIFGRQTAVGDARAITARLTTPEAQVGARKAIVDWIWDKFISNTAAGTTDENLIRADQFQQFIKLKADVLREFGFTPEQISMWQRISDDLRQAKQSIDATKMRGGPGTAQDLRAMYEMENTGLGASLMSKIMLRLMGGSIGWATEGPIGGAAGLLGAGVVSAMRDRGIRSVQELVKHAMMNPAEARRLMQRVRGRQVQRDPGMKKFIGYQAASGGSEDAAEPAGRKHGGAVRPLGREGIQARNKARAVAARERSTLARGAAQAKRKVRFQEGGEVSGEPPEFTRSARLKQAPREVASGSALLPSQAPIDPKYGRLPQSQNIEDRRGQSSWVGDIAGFSPEEWGTMARRPLTPIQESLSRYRQLEVPPYQPGSLEEQAGRGSIGRAEGGVVPYATDSPEFKEEVARALATSQDAIAKKQEFYPRVPLNDKAWGQFIENAPASINIEDRRPGYKGGLRAAHRPFASGGSVKDDSSKTTKKSVDYSKGMPKAHCGICRFWQKGRCSKVQGTIYASMWCKLFRAKGKYQEGGLVEEEDPLEAELKRRNVPGGLSATAGPTVTSTTPVQDIPAPKVNSQGETLPTYALKEMGKGLISLPERATKEAGDLQRRGEYGGSHEDLPGFQGPGEKPAALEVVQNLYGLNAPFAGPGIGVFGGKGAKTANLPMLAEAERMLKEGVPHETIRNRTGWEFGADGKPRFEISDAEARIKPEHPEDRIYEADAYSRPSGFRPNQRMEQQMEHPAAYEAYPWLKDMRTSLEIGEGIKPGASYTPPTTNQKRFGRTGEIEVRAPTSERGGVGDLFGEQYASDTGARDMLLHEMQHAIQEAEKFAPGANPRHLPVRPSEISGIAQRIAEKQGIDWANASPKDREQMERVVRYRIYKMHAGETEARNVQTRADDTLRQRPSWKTEDVPREQQIIERKGKRKPGEKPFEDAKIYKYEREPEQPSKPAILKSEFDRPLFDYSRMAEVPNVPQFDLPRINPARGVPEHMQRLGKPENVKRVNKIVDMGLQHGGREWYNTMPLRERYVGELGTARGPEAWDSYMKYVGATSPRTPVPTNIGVASHYDMLAAQGRPFPEPVWQPKSKTWSLPEGQLPEGYGSLAQATNAHNAQIIRESGGWPSWTHFDKPKPPSFTSNLLGNYQPLTSDVHNVSMLNMRRPDLPSGAPGERLIMPPHQYYGHVEKLQQGEAAKKGIAPAQYQAAGWIPWAAGYREVGRHGEVTGGSPKKLASYSEPFVKTVEDRVKKKARQLGWSPEQTLRAFLRKEIAIAGVPAAAIPFLQSLQIDQEE